MCVCVCVHGCECISWDEDREVATESIWSVCVCGVRVCVPVLIFTFSLTRMWTAEGEDCSHTKPGRLAADLTHHADLHSVQEPSGGAEGVVDPR